MSYLKWSSSVDNCRRFFDDGHENSLFPLVEAMDEVYRLVPQKAPFVPNNTNDEAAVYFDRCFFVCHRSFLSSPMAIGSGLPEDGEAITRRALEAAKACLAIKANPVNGEAWLQTENRMNRSTEREKGCKPKSIQVNYRTVNTEPLYEELQSEIGALSDFSVHFTPEYFGPYEWEKLPNKDGGLDLSSDCAKARLRSPF